MRCPHNSSTVTAKQINHVWLHTAPIQKCVLIIWDVTFTKELMLMGLSTCVYDSRIMQQLPCMPTFNETWWEGVALVEEEPIQF